MQVQFRRILAVFLCITGPVWSHAEAESTKDLESRFARDREALTWKYIEKRNEVRLSYTNAVAAVEKALKEKGDLEGVLAARKEMESFKAIADGSLPSDTTVPAISDIRERQQKLLSRNDLDEKRELVGLARRYVERLKALEKELTIENKIDEAVAVQARRKKVMEDPDLVAASAALKEEGVSSPRSEPPETEQPAQKPDDGSRALFNGNDLEGFDVLEGEWDVVDGRIQGRSEGRSAKLQVSAWPGRDYEFSVRVKVVDGEHAGIVFHDRGWRGYYFAPKLGLCEAGSKASLTSVVRDFSQDKWHDIAVTVHGNTVRVYVDGKSTGWRENLVVEDGRIGLWLKGNATAVFENPRLKAIKPLMKLSPKPSERRSHHGGLSSRYGLNSMPR